MAEEKQISTICSWTNAEPVKGSGAGTFAKGDVKNYRFLMECKAGLSKLPKTPGFGVFAKITKEAMLQKRIPMVSTAWIDCSVPDDPEVIEIRFFVPKAHISPKAGGRVFTAIPPEKTIYTTLTEWVELTDREFIRAVETEQWKDPKKKPRSRLTKRSNKDSPK